jgi:hypothetical protein
MVSLGEGGGDGKAREHSSKAKAPVEDTECTATIALKDPKAPDEGLSEATFPWGQRQHSWFF